MPDYNIEEWQRAVGKTTIDVEERHYIQIQVSCSQDVQVFGVSKEAEIPLKIGREFKFKAKTAGLDQVIIKGKPATPYGLCIKHRAIQDGDPIDHENPPSPPIPGEGNMLLKIRSIMQQQARNNRQPVLEPEDLPFATRYEIEDDDDRFEEEIIASMQNSQHNNEPTGEPGTEDATSAPEARPDSEETPSDDQLAAE